MVGNSGISAVTVPAAGLNSGGQSRPLPPLKATSPERQQFPQPVPAPVKLDKKSEARPKMEKLETFKLEEFIERISQEDMSSFLSKINMSTNLFAIDRDIRYDEQIRWYRIVIRNTETGRIIRKIPPWDLSGIVEHISSQVGKQFNFVV